MPAAIELHDSDLSAVTREGAAAVVTFSPAYLHRWEGRMGDPTHHGWLQPTTLTFTDAPGFPVPVLPGVVSGGSLRIGDVVHDNLIPAAGVFAEACELRLTLTAAERLTVRGTRLTIAPAGAPVYVESCAD